MTDSTIASGRLAGKVALVTGGGDGIGRAICHRMADQGATVVVLDRDLDAAERVVAEIVGAGHQGAAIRTDVTSEESVRAAVEEADRRFGRIDVLVNNAGIPGPGVPTHEVELADFEAVFAVNARGPFLCTKHVIPVMRRAGSGSIVYISSINGLVGNTDLPVYNATKGAVRLMAKTDALLYAPDGIRVNSVHPGSIRTRLAERAALEDPRGPEEYFRDLVSRHPIGFQGVPDDVAHGVVYLASDEARFVTGTELVIDGGYTAQ